MVNLIPPPAGVQDRQVYDYLYQLQEYLGLVLDGIGDPGGAVVAAAQLGAKEAGASAVKAASTEIQQQVQYLKALIIKTADEVESHTQIDLSNLRAFIDQLGDVIEGDGGLRAILMQIQGDYVARSEFGTYAERTALQLEAAAGALTQYIGTVGELQSGVNAVGAAFSAWRIESEGYIRSGIVGYREDTTPIIGIAIGQNLTVLQDAEGNDVTVTVTDGEGNEHTYKVVEQKGFRAIYAADELSFWQDDVKVAYMNNQRLYITDVVALASLRVGSWKVEDTANGLVFKWEG